MEIPTRLAALVGFITIHRVLGELSLTRALGDREYKGKFKVTLVIELTNRIYIGMLNSNQI